MRLRQVNSQEAFHRRVRRLVLAWQTNLRRHHHIQHYHLRRPFHQQEEQTQEFALLFSRLTAYCLNCPLRHDCHAPHRFPSVRMRKKQSCTWAGHSSLSVSRPTLVFLCLFHCLQNHCRRLMALQRCHPVRARLEARQVFVVRDQLWIVASDDSTTKMRPAIGKTMERSEQKVTSQAMGS